MVNYMTKLWRTARKRIRRISRRDVFVLGIGILLAVIGFRLEKDIYNHQVPLAPESTTITSPWIPPTVKHWQPTIETMAKRYNIDPNLLAIIMTLESGGYAAADSGQAQGLMQITPVTGQDIENHYIKDKVRIYNLKDPATSIEFGAAYLAKLRDIYGTADQGPTWNNSVELIAAAYNGGFGAANSLLKGTGLSDSQTVVYSRDAYNMWRERHAEHSPTFDRWKERGGSDLLNKAQASLQL